MKPKTELILDSLISARGYIGAQLNEWLRVGRAVRPEQLEIVRNLDRSIGSLMRAGLGHDAGAWARCSFCQRYSADPRALHAQPFACDCGEAHGWSGSFERPGPKAEWSLGLREEKS